MTTVSGPTKPSPTEPRPLGFGFALTLGMMAGFTSVLSAGAGVVLPDIANSLQIPTITSVWVISGFSLAYGVSMAIYGRVGDLVGLRLPLAVGTLLMAFGSILSAVSINFPMLMVGRILQGIGGASIPVLAVAAITSFKSNYLNTSGLALVTGMSSVGAGLGPLIGGGLERLFSWRASLGVPALVIVLLAIVWPRIPSKGTKSKLDVVGAILVALVASGIILVVQSASTGRTVMIIGAVALFLSLPALLSWIHKHPHGFLPDTVIKNRTVVRVAVAATCVPIAWFSLLVAVPIMFHSLGWHPINIGLALAPSALTGLIAARQAAKFITRIGPIQTLMISGGLSGMALICGFLGGHYSIPLLLALSVYLVTSGFGFAQPSMVAKINQSVSEDVRGVALGAAIMTQFVSGGIGAAAIGGFADILGIANSVLALLIFPVFSLLLLRRRQEETK